MAIIQDNLRQAALPVNNWEKMLESPQWSYLRHLCTITYYISPEA